MAVGDIGMSVDDFCRCTPAEFRSIADAYRLSIERKERSEWERTRMQCVCMLQPYSKSRIDPKELMLFPWEDTEGDQDEKLTTKEIWEKFEKVKREQGLI
jgi:hypothetical protein